MFFAAFLGVTLVPVLMVLLIRGKITPEIKNPVNRFLIRVYQTFVNFALRYLVPLLGFRWLPWQRLRDLTTVLVGLIAIALLTYLPFSRLGSEFMPPLNEGTLLYMPTAIPGMSIA